MEIKQIHTACLAEFSYFIYSGGEAAVIDPIRDVEQYLRMAEELGVEIKYVFETHFHADFISGHTELAAKTGAKIVYGPGAQAEYPIYNAGDGEIIPLGKASIRWIHTPGHTLESSCILAMDEYGKPIALFTGDTLFLGDAGRPDLAVKPGYSQEKLARMLYHSIYDKILKLPGDIVLYPGHGQGSPCGKDMDDKMYDTLENQRKYNYLLLNLKEEEFVEKILDRITPPPAYFPMNAEYNQKKLTPNEQVIKSAQHRISQKELSTLLSEGVCFIDCRSVDSIPDAILPFALRIGLDGAFALWLGTFIKDIHRRIVFTCDEGKELECVKRMMRVGFERIEGYIPAGELESKMRRVQVLKANQNNGDNVVVVDLRNSYDYLDGHYEDAVNVPLLQLEVVSKKWDKQKTYILYCQTYYRSVIAMSFLMLQGFKHLYLMEYNPEYIVFADES